MRGSNATWHSSGESTGHFRIDAVGREVMMDYWMRFRLSKFADLFGVAITGHSAPYASIRIILTMNSSGRANVRFRSSFIPSQHFYLGWELAGKYDMLKCAGQDFVGFVQAGKRQDASTGERFEIGLETKRVSLKGLR